MLEAEVIESSRREAPGEKSTTHDCFDLGAEPPNLTTQQRDIDSASTCPCFVLFSRLCPARILCLLHQMLQRCSIWWQ